MEIWIFSNATYERFLILLKIDTYVNKIKFRVGSYLITDLTFIWCNETNLHLRTLLCLFLQFLFWQVERAFGLTCRTSRSGPPSKVVPNILVETKPKWSINFWILGWMEGAPCVSLQEFSTYGRLILQGFGDEIAVTTVWCLCMSVNTNL